MKDTRDQIVYGVITYLLRDNEVLLVYKKRGHGAGKWNGPGGKIEKENPVEAAIRETKEETGVEVNNPELCGIIEFYDVYEQDWIVYIFRSEEFSGEPKESEECFPRWFHLEEIPYHKMWEDDKIWLPLVINKKYFWAKFWFKDEKMLKYNLQEMSKEDFLSLQKEFLKI